MSNLLNALVLQLMILLLGSHAMAAGNGQSRVVSQTNHPVGGQGIEPEINNSFYKTLPLNNPSGNMNMKGMQAYGVTAAVSPAILNLGAWSTVPGMDIKQAHPMQLADNTEERHAELAQATVDNFKQMQTAFQQPQPALQTNEVFRDCPDCPEMVKIAPGSFKMDDPSSPGGLRMSNPSSQEKLTVHQQVIIVAPLPIDSPSGSPRRVTISQPFAIGKYEVTFEEWDACVTAGGCRSYSPYDLDWGRGRRPVINVNWHDVQAYISWLSKKTGKTYRLPNRFEWEYATRAGTTTIYYWGDEIGIKNANCLICDPQWRFDNKTVPVGSYPPNAFGLYDMLGNVWELVNCDYESCGSYLTAGDGSCDQGMLRGGSWRDQRIHITDYACMSGNNSLAGGGFRLARTLP